MNRQILHPILLGPILHQILNPIINDGDILNQSFNEQKEIIKPLQVEFKEQLEIHTVTEKDTREKLSCAICQDIFTLNENIIKLPCNGKPHFFHKENTEECKQSRDGATWQQKDHICLCGWDHNRQNEQDTNANSWQQIQNSLFI